MTESIITYETKDSIKKTIRLLEQIGKGGFGTVWRAVDDDFGIVAVKLQERIGSVIIQGIQTELTLSSEKIPNFISLKYMIIRQSYYKTYSYTFQSSDIVFSSITLPEKIVFASIYNMAETSLDKLIKISYTDGIRLSKHMYQKYCIDLLTGLKALHGLGYVHRDIKPANIMLEHQELKYIDFGLSCLHSACSSGIAGTFWYMSPSYLTLPNGHKLSEKGLYDNDIFALGVTILQMIS